MCFFPSYQLYFTWAAQREETALLKSYLSSLLHHRKGHTARFDCEDLWASTFTQDVIKKGQTHEQSSLFIFIFIHSSARNLLCIQWIKFFLVKIWHDVCNPYVKIFQRWRKVSLLKFYQEKSLLIVFRI